MSTAFNVREKLNSLRLQRQNLVEVLESRNEELSGIQDDIKKFEVSRWKKFCKMDELERRVSTLNSMLEEKLQKISELEKSNLECLKLIESFRSQEASRAGKLQELEEKEVEFIENASSVARSNVEIVDRLHDARNKLEQAEKQEEKLERIMSLMRVEEYMLTTDLQVASSESKVDENVKILQTKVDELTIRLNRSNERAFKAERELDSLSLELAHLDEEGNEWLSKVQGLQQHLDSAKATMQ